MLGGALDVDTAVQAATAAFESWSESSLTQRTQVMFAFRRLLVEHEEELARIISAEHGKTVDDARGEIVRGREVVEFTCSLGASAGKRVQALGGAKNHAVVLPDADLEFAANHITAGAYGSAGERCMAVPRGSASPASAFAAATRGPSLRWGSTARVCRASARRG
ncbi:aldehyde dehydrogenase family protein [Streptomyces sp. BK340]|nr:aldehyde dehydrogenase family protein [Streptomyces sp. BK340]